MAAASYEWAVSVDGEDWTVVETEDDDTFAVTADLVGMYVKVTVTAEDGETASDATVLPVEEASGQIEILAATATKANEVEVTLAEPVDAADTTITLTKGTDEFAFTFKWSDTNNSVTLTTAAKLVEGTYTVTLTSKEDATNTDSADFETEKQAVDEIVILNDVAYTNADTETPANAHKKAYAYYDVIDQYGESMRASSSITWAGSCKIKADKSTGQLELTKSDGNAWVYGDKIYLTGVHTKTGAALSKELTVGTEQSLDTIEMVGFVKKGTSTIIEAKKGLPAGFKKGEYYMVFNALDQNGNPFKAEDVTNKDVTFVTDNPMVIKELTTFKANGLTIEGTLYCAVEVEPGIKVADGGEVTVTAIANKTGNKSEVNFVVGEDPVVASFVLSAPSKTVADGDTGVEIPFEATDEHGNAVTNFRTIAKQETFNTVTFAASEGHLILKEADNGTAKLVWNDEEMPWTDNRTTDGIDRPIILTVIVVGGESSNERMDVQDKRRPEAIAGVDMKSVYVEGAAITFGNTSSFQFYDQYGSLIDTDGDATDYGDDNGFFAADAGGQLVGVGFVDYDFGVRVKNAGSGEIKKTGGTTTVVNGDTKEYVLENGKTAKFETLEDIQSAATGEGFKFEVAKIDRAEYNTAPLKNEATNWESVSSSKYIPVTVVDITQVKNLEIAALNTFYVGDLDVTGDKMISSERFADLKDTALTVVAGGTAGIYDADSSYKQAVKVSGTYNGKEVDVPVNYYDIAANKLEDTAVSYDSDGNVVKAFDAIIPLDDEHENGLQAADLYDKTTAKGVAKLANDEMTATVYQIYGDDETYFWAWNGEALEMVKYNVSDYASKAAAKAAANATLGETGGEEETAAKTAVLKAQQREIINTYLPTEDVSTNEKLTAFLTEAYAPKASSLEAAEAKATKLTQDLATARSNLDTAKNATLLKAAELSADDLAAAQTLIDNGTVDKDTGNDAIEALDDGDGLSDEATILAAQQAWLKAKVAELNAQATYNTLNGDENTEGSVREAQKDVLVWTKKTAADEANTLAADTVTIAEINGEGTDTVANVFAAARNANTNGVTEKAVYDTAKAAITLSDQAPYAAKIDGLDESYTLNPTFTESLTVLEDLSTTTRIAAGLPKVKVLDQYGVKFSTDIIYTIKDVIESKEGYAENNFKVSSNGTSDTSISGAERGDTFTLVASYNEIKTTATVTVGADTLADIYDSHNNYRDVLIGEEGDGGLEDQRLAGLGV